MKKKSKKRSAFLVLALISQSAWSYEQLTHQDLSEKAFTATKVKQDSTLLAELGLLPAQQLPGSDSDPRSILGLIRHGADLEDEGTRPKNHFFDPEYDRPASLPPWLTVAIPVGEMSVDWAVNGTGQDGIQFSVRQARSAFVEGLAAASPEWRERAWGHMFQSLGHVIHHLQDMAQPQHVRNDIHYINETLATHFDGELKLTWEDRSWFERYTLENPAVWQAYAPAAVAPVNFPRARDFWVTLDGRGVAQFTNRNFVSSDTNFTYGGDGKDAPAADYPLPQPIGRNTQSVRDPALGIANAEELCTRLASHPVARSQPCMIDFVEARVVDDYAGGAAVLNDRAASLSVFDAQLQDVDQARLGLRVYTLNSINFKAAYRFLIPKAVNYSAGMINHFFRGRMQLRNTEVQDGNITIEIANSSAPGNDFSDGKFWIHYDSFDGVRKPLEAYGGDLAVGARRQLKFAVPADLDLQAENPFALVFEGRIGGDDGVAGLVFDVPNVGEGFVFRAGLPDGPLPAQLLFRSSGQWRVYPQGLLPTGGSVDWKGWYVDGKPTRVLTWDGWRYAKLHGVNAFRSPNIFQDGKLLAVAPWNVLGAALQKDADGNAWIVAICDDTTLDQDVVIRRPARKSGSAALYDAVAAPDGWRVLGRHPRADLHSPQRDTWQFNGAGTEAQTLRALIGAGFEYGTWTRLKVTVSGDSAVFQDLGNTTAVRTVVTDTTASKTKDGQTYDYCSGSGTVDQTVTTSTTGGSVVAVDYVDDREVLARISVESSGVATEHGSLSFESTQVEVDSTDASRWTLEIGAARHELLTNDYSYQLRLKSKDSYSFESRRIYSQAAIVALDLRSGVVVLQRRHVESTSESPDPATYNDPITESISIYRQYAFEGPVDGVSPRVDASSTVNALYRAWPLTTTRSCFSNLIPSGRTTHVSEFGVGVLVGQGSYNRYADGIGAATDRAGNVFLSLRHTDTVTKQMHFLNYLTGTDPVALLGTRDFEAIRPR